MIINDFKIYVEFNKKDIEVLYEALASYIITEVVKYIIYTEKSKISEEDFRRHMKNEIDQLNKYANILEQKINGDLIVEEIFKNDSLGKKYRRKIDNCIYTLIRDENEFVLFASDKMTNNSTILVYKKDLENDWIELKMHESTI